MKERPILFSTDMVSAILDGKKTMTRRVVNPQPESVYYSPSEPNVQRMKWKGCTYRPATCADCPYGLVGDRLWVRETWASDCTCENPKCNGVIYKAGYSGVIVPDKWNPSIFMPRWASRITLEVTNIRVERLQEIAHVDVEKEGIPINPFGRKDYGNASCLRIVDFSDLWDSINAKRGYSWKSNPFCWVIEFKKC